MGEQSGSEAGASHRSQDDEEEDDNLSEDLEDDNEKDEGTFPNHKRQEGSATCRPFISLIKRSARKRSFLWQSIKTER